MSNSCADKGWNIPTDSVGGKATLLDNIAMCMYLNASLFVVVQNNPESCPIHETGH